MTKVTNSPQMGALSRRQQILYYQLLAKARLDAKLHQHAERYALCNYLMHQQLRSIKATSNALC